VSSEYAVRRRLVPIEISDIEGYRADDGKPDDQGCPSCEDRTAAYKRSRTASPSPISSGATVTIPSEDAANQRPHTWRGDVVGLIRLMAAIAPAAVIADPTAVAVKNQSTRGTSSSLKALPNHRSSNQAVRRVCTDKDSSGHWQACPGTQGDQCAH